ncbi:MAG: TonB-dependent receptor plug domain-containing protein, partial [Macellibacteroides fermentans]|nr:TonB-dependent receptor plug domain-containing protein [Parabacteroides sp.]
MKKVEKIAGQALRFRRFARKNFAVFCSLHKVVNIGVITASTLLFALPDTAQAQEVIKHAASEEETSVSLDEVEVTASRAPMALNQAARIVTVISAREIAAAPVTSIQDLLEYAAGVDVRQRGEGGTQADISIRGGTFDQIAVLLNGVNLSNPQTGHYSFDIPVNLSDIERIEIISGPASRIFGASAFAGAINIITKAKAEKVITTDVSAGMHEWWKLEAGINHQSGNFSQRLSAGYNSSGGYTDNTDFKILNLFWQGVARTDEADLSFQAGINDKGYGANSFYSAAYPNQYDKTRRYFLSAG